MPGTSGPVTWALVVYKLDNYWHRRLVSMLFNLIRSLAYACDFKISNLGGFGKLIGCCFLRRAFVGRANFLGYTSMFCSIELSKKYVKKKRKLRVNFLKTKIITS